MWEWIVTQVSDLSNTLSGGAASINNSISVMNSQQFTDTSLLFQYIGAIHYVAGDVIFYNCMMIVIFGIGVTIYKIIIAILRLIRDVKQTALF